MFPVGACRTRPYWEHLIPKVGVVAKRPNLRNQFLGQFTKSPEGAKCSKGVQPLEFEIGGKAEKVFFIFALL